MRALLSLTLIAFGLFGSERAYAQQTPQTLQTPKIPTERPAAVRAHDESAENALLRAKILSAHVDEYVSWLNRVEIVGGASLALSLVGAGFGVHYWETDRRFAVTEVVGAGVELSAVTAALLTSRRTTDDVLRLTLYATPVVAGLAAGLSESVTPRERVTFFAFSGGVFGSAVLTGSNILLRRTPTSAIRKAQLRFRYGDWSTPAELAAIERDFLGTEEPIPRPLVTLPSLLGGLVALAPALDGGANSEERMVALVLGGLMVFGAINEGLGVPLVRGYRDTLRVQRLELAAGPGRVALVGAF